MTFWSIHNQSPQVIQLGKYKGKKNNKKLKKKLKNKEAVYRAKVSRHSQVGQELEGVVMD